MASMASARSPERSPSMSCRRRRAMPRSSESVAALAAALAKAQAELINPEKSLTATIRTGRAGDTDQDFSLCPAIERPRHRTQNAGSARDRNGANHSHRSGSGYSQFDHHARPCVWRMGRLGMASVSGRGILASPRRMGAALTYARRYALFTLVGIAGEDDLDAPDIQETNVCSPGSAGNPVNPGGASGQSRLPSRSSGNGHSRDAVNGGSPAVLDAVQSAALRDRLSRRDR